MDSDEVTNKQHISVEDVIDPIDVILGEVLTDLFGPPSLRSNSPPSVSPAILSDTSIPNLIFNK